MPPNAKRDQNSVTTLMAVSNADGVTPVVLWADPVTHRLLVASSGGSASLVVGSTTITSGTNTRVLYDNNGVLGEYPITGSGSVVLGTAPSISGATITTSTVNGVTLTTGGSSSQFLNGTGSYSSPGGSGTVNTGTAGQIAYYQTSTNAVNGNANLTISSAALTVGVAGSVLGTVILANGTSGGTTLTPSATSANTLTLPASTDTLVGRATTDTLTNKTLTTPVINGTITGTGQSTSATASVITMRDANANVTANNYIESFATTATAAGTTVLTVSSAGIQAFTGTTTQTVTMPVASTLVAGQSFTIINNSTGIVTVQTSGANTLIAMTPSSQATFTVVNASGGTGTASWNWEYTGFPVITGTGSNVLATSPTLVTPNIGAATGTSLVLTNSSANGLVDGPNGTTNPTLQVDSSTASAATGLKIKSAAAAAGLAVSVISSGTNENLTIDAKGSGTVTLGSVSTGAITFGQNAVPATNGTQALGTTALSWLNLFLASGGTINFNNGNVVLTHANGTSSLTVSTGDLRVTTAGTASTSVVTTQGTQTLQNKRYVKLTSTQSGPGASPTYSTDTSVYIDFTALAANITSMTTNAGGTPNRGDTLWLSFTDNGTARTISWGANFEASTVALPTTTVISTRLDVGFIWNTVTSKWRCVAVA